MQNPRFIYTDLTAYDFTSVTPVNEDPEYPVSNLSNYDPASYWKGRDTTDPQYLTVDFGTAAARNVVVVDGTNFGTLTAVSTVALQAADSSDFTSGLVNIGAITEVADDTPYTQFLSASVTKRFWRLTFSDTLVEQPRVGNLFVDSYLEFDTTYGNNYIGGDREYNTYEATSISGRIRSGQSYAARPVWEFRFSLQTNAVRSEFQTFQQAVQGKTRPFYFQDIDSRLQYVHLAEDYTPVIGHRYGRHNIESLILRQRNVQ